MRDTKRDWVFGVACFLVALIGQAAFVVLVLGLGLGWSIPRPLAPWPWSISINAAWLIVFAAQHSGMARTGFKQWLARRFPAHLQRSLYVAISGLVVLGLSLTWQPLPGESLWSGPAWIVAVALAGLMGVIWVSFGFDHRSFFGLRQAWTKHVETNEPLIVSGPYRYVRHPLMTATLVFLWGHATMPPALLLLAGALTVYIVAALRLEERDLERAFGPAYEEYRRKTPALLPWRIRA